VTNDINKTTRFEQDFQTRRYQVMHRLMKLSAFAVLLWGCAEQQPAVNRVEAYALPKTLFTGEWFYQQTVVDTPGTKTVTFEGETAFMGTHRIRWDVQEKYLYARAAYEKVEGGKNQSQDTGEYMGEIVGAWAISSQFDIKRGYNPTTGEENNVLEENASDCKWYDCKYMRVDWSRNLAIDFYFLDWDESIKKEAIPFYVQDNDPKFKPIFDQSAGYIDITTAMAVAPGEVYFPGWVASPTAGCSARRTRAATRRSSRCGTRSGVGTRTGTTSRG